MPCGPPVRAWETWSLLDEGARKGLQPLTWMAPAYQRLAMGSSHSVHILMSINITAAGRAMMASRRLLDAPAEAEAREAQTDAG